MPRGSWLFLEPLGIITNGMPRQRADLETSGNKKETGLPISHNHLERADQGSGWKEGEKREEKVPLPPHSHLTQRLAVIDFRSAIYASLLKTQAVKLVFLLLEKFCQMP